MSLSKLLKTPQAELINDKGEPMKPTEAWTPSVVENGDGTTNLTAVRDLSKDKPSRFEELLRSEGYDPAEYMVAPNGVQVKNWEALRKAWVEDDSERGGHHETEKVPMRGYKLTIVKRPYGAVDVDELAELVSSKGEVPNVRRGGLPATYMFAAGDQQWSKALNSDTPILTTKGWTTHGELEVGDFVYAPSGKPVEVLNVLPTSVQELYEVELADGNTVTASGDHLWNVERKYHPREYKRAGGTPWELREFTATTREMLESAECAAWQSRPYMVPEQKALEFPEVELPIDPHLLGLWLGDGRSDSGMVTKGIQDADLLLQYGYHVKGASREGSTIGVRIPGLTTELRKAGLLGNKHIPEAYLKGSVEQRLALVQGLMDTDGTVSASGEASFCNTNPAIIQGMVKLLTSLGIRHRVTSHIPKIYGVEYSEAWGIYFRTELPVFTLKRKGDRMRPTQERGGMRRVITSITPVGEGEAQCITVEGGQYLAGEGLVPTHNCDGDGLKGQVGRHKEVTLKSVEEATSNPKVTDILIAFTGDACELFSSQGGKNAWRATLTLTEQLRLMRRMYLWTIDQFIDAGFKNIKVVAVPSNHGRMHDTMVKTRVDDNYDVDGLVAVADSMELNPERYGGVQCYVPRADEQHVSLEVNGLNISVMHGDAWRPGSHWKFWEGQAFGQTDIGKSRVLLCGHGHHLHIEERDVRTFIMTPALEEVSSWWKQKTGTTGHPGAVSAIISDGEIEMIHKIHATYRGESVHAGK